MNHFADRVPFSATVTNASKLFVMVSPPQPIVTEDMKKLLDDVLNVLIFALGTMGVVTNAINIRVFVQQGLSSDSNTVCLFALAISDFTGCFVIVPYTLCQLFQHTSFATVILSCHSIATLTCTIPHVAMARVTCWITAYIAIERCLCVLMPFRVKMLLRPRVAVMSMTLIYVIIISSFVPFVSTFRFGWRYVEATNGTAIALHTRAMGKAIGKYLNLTFNSGLTPLAAIIAATATGIMLHKLKKYRQWRDETTSAGKKRRVKGDNLDSKRPDAVHVRREIEAMKIVLMVTGPFVFCISMSLLPGIASAFLPGFSLVGINRNLFATFFLYKYLFGVINSSINFFFYLKISTRYRKAFDIVFGKK